VDVELFIPEKKPQENPYESRSKRSGETRNTMYRMNTGGDKSSSGSTSRRRNAPDGKSIESFHYIDKTSATL